MGVVCPACGSVSQDTELCDHCDSELIRWSRQVPPSIHPFTAEPLSPLQSGTFTNARYCLLHEDGVKTWRARWLDTEHWAHWQPFFRHRQKVAARCLPSCQLKETTHGVWIIAETVADQVFPWNHAPEVDSVVEVRRLLTVLRPLSRALEELHVLGLAWLSFSPFAMEFIHEDEDVAGQAPTITGVRFTNMDLRVFPVRKYPHEVVIEPAFSAPEVRRGRVEEIGPRTDVFHLAIFAYYWLARRLPDGFPGDGLDAFGYRVPNVRIYAPQVPLGVPRILAKGLSLAAGQRYAKPSELCDALEETVEKARIRQAFAGELAWEIGTHTRTGKTKGLLGHGNEDQALAHQFENPPRALIIVADGITICDVGSGALASLITTIILENAFAGDSDEQDFEVKIRDACKRATRALLDWALDKGYRDQLIQGMDLMGTTLTAGWIEGRTLHLANLGDSRAYLITADGFEQLTVDGDFANTMLQSGHSPDEVLELGMMGRSLSKCIGGCVLSERGNVMIVEDSCEPTLSEWRLLPGDVIVLCSDGLVDEGIFLEPAILAETVRDEKDLSSQKLAERLADLADAVQRPPSPLEPEGLGDNISCIVVKVRESGVSSKGSEFRSLET